MRLLPILGLCATTALFVMVGCQQDLPTSTDVDSPNVEAANPLAFAEGSVGIVTGGVGLASQPASFSVTVPNDATVVEAAFYWDGRARTNSTGDDTIFINAVEYVGTLVSGFFPGSNPYYSMFYKLDATALVAPGLNTFEIDGFDPPGSPGLPDGIGLYVIYEQDGAGNNVIMTQDLGQFFYWQTAGFEQTPVNNFTIDPSAVERTGTLTIFVGDCAADRSDRLWYHSGAGTAHPGDLVGGAFPFVENVLTDANGPQFHVYSWDVTIPAGAEHVAFQCESPEEGNGDSGQLNFAALFIPGECTGALGDYVWYDADRDGIQDAEEDGIEGVVVELYDGSDNFITSTTTDSNGFYSFGGLCAGDYCVVVDETTLPAGYLPTPCNVGGDDSIDNDCSPYCVTLPDDTFDDTIDFGYAPEPMEGDEGCTPGYWGRRHHFCHWPSPYTTDTNFETVFGRAVPEVTTLLDGLNSQGNYQNLVFHAVAALLNAASDEVNYPYSVDHVIATFQSGWDSGNYGPAKSELEDANESDCPLGNCRGNGR